MESSVVENFKTCYCRDRSVDLKDYEKTLWQEGMYWHARFLLSFVELIDEDFFGAERYLIKRLGECYDMEAIQIEIDLYHAKEVDTSFFRGVLRFRLRCRKVASFARQWIPQRRKTVRTDRSQDKAS